MGKLMISALAISVILLFGPAAFAQRAGGTASEGGITGSGGERPYEGNTSREQDDFMRPKLNAPKTDEYAEGIKALGQHDFPGAIQHLDAAVKQKPGDTNALFYAGYAHHMSGQKETGAAQSADFATALNDYKRSVAADGSNKTAHQYLGVLSLQLHDVAAAQDQERTLEGLCPSGCEELTKLQASLQPYLTAAPATSSPQ